MPAVAQMKTDSLLIRPGKWGAQAVRFSCADRKIQGQQSIRMRGIFRRGALSGRDLSG